MEETMSAACEKINSVLDKLDLLGVDGGVAAGGMAVMDRTRRLEELSNTLGRIALEAGDDGQKQQMMQQLVDDQLKQME